MKRTRALIGTALISLLLNAGQLLAEGLLDGQVFSGTIGPVENPDLADSLFFSDGYFWSDICTRCGFMPGRYDARETQRGIVFTGTLESDSRGRFEYSGLVAPDGSVDVEIQWERRRWYWTSQRMIAFVGTAQSGHDTTSLSAIQERMSAIDPGSNPLCDRF